MEIRSVHTIQSVENTPIELELAGVGNRVFAFILDFLAMATSFVILLIAFSLLVRYSGELSKTLLNLLLVGSMMYAFLFQFLQEWLWKGKSLGKQLLHIRVVRHDGQVIGFWESFGRNLLRFIDVYVMGIGLFPILFTPREKRFGDFLVGTLVINDQKLIKPALTVSDARQEKHTGQSHALPPEEHAVLGAYLSKKSKLLKTSQQKLTHQLTAYFKETLHLSQEVAESPTFLEQLYHSVE